MAGAVQFPGGSVEGQVAALVGAGAGDRRELAAGAVDVAADGTEVEGPDGAVGEVGAVAYGVPGTADGGEGGRSGARTSRGGQGMVECGAAGRTHRGGGGGRGGELDDAPPRGRGWLGGGEFGGQAAV